PAACAAALEIKTAMAASSRDGPVIIILHPFVVVPMARSRGRAVLGAVATLPGPSRLRLGPAVLDRRLPALRHSRLRLAGRSLRDAHRDGFGRVARTAKNAGEKVAIALQQRVSVVPARLDMDFQAGIGHPHPDLQRAELGR